MDFSLIASIIQIPDWAVQVCISLFKEKRGNQSSEFKKNSDIYLDNFAVDLCSRFFQAKSVNIKQTIFGKTRKPKKQSLISLTKLYL